MFNGKQRFFTPEIKETMDSVGTESEWKTVYARYKINPWDTEENAKVITEGSPIVKFSSLQRSRNGFNKRFDPNLVNDIFSVDKEIKAKKPLINEYDDNNNNDDDEQFNQTNAWKFNNEPTVPTVPQQQWNTDWSEEQPLRESRSQSKQAKQSSMMIQAMEQRKRNQEKKQKDKEEEKENEKKKNRKVVEEKEEEGDDEELQEINDEGNDIFNPLEFQKIQTTDLKQINVKSQKQINEMNQQLIKDEIILDSNTKKMNKSSQQIDF